MPDKPHVNIDKETPEESKREAPAGVKVEQPQVAPEVQPVSTEQPAPTPEGAGAEIHEKIKAGKEEDEGFLDEAIDGLKNKLKGRKKKPTKIPQIRDEMTVQIEKILEEDLQDAYNELTPIQKQEFKIKGEKIAYEIRDMMKRTHVRVKSVFKLLLEWLRMLPGINRFFLEQEAKIKTDKILALKEISSHSERK